MAPWMPTACRSSTKDATSRRVTAGRRPRRSIGGAAVVLVMGLLQLGTAAATGFSAGEPINLVVTASDRIEVAFAGSNTDALAVSFQQCSGSRYLNMDVRYNGTSLLDNSVSSSECNRVVAGGASVDDQSIQYDQLCTFKNSGTVGLGYNEASATLNTTIFVDPSFLTVVLTNRGDVAAAAQLVLFTSDFPAPNADEAIDRVNTIAEQDDNTYTVEVDFQASAGEDESFCSTEEGCAVYAYYLVIDEDEDADFIFGTTCQARTGTMVYEGFTSGDSTTEALGAGVLATTAFSLTACLQFPVNVEADYRVYLVVSPDTASYARVGYGLQDQLVFASPILEVDSDMDLVCPEVEEDGDEGSSGGSRMVVTPIKATGMMAMSLAAAASRAGY